MRRQARLRTVRLLAVLGMVAVGSSAAAQSAFSAHTLTLDDGSASPSANIEDLAWLAGFWGGEVAALGGRSEEVWTPPSGGTMTSTYKLVQGDGVAFYEFQTISEEAGSLVLRLKHFNADMTGWEERGDYVEFPLVKLEPGAAYFDGLTYLLKGKDQLHIYAVLEGAEGEDAEAGFFLERIWQSEAAPAFTPISGIPATTDRASTGGVTWVDYDDDGDVDIYVTNGYDVSADEAVAQPNRLYRNDGAGRLTPVTAGPLVSLDGFSSGSTWADYDNDGDLDAFVSNQRGQDNFLFRNDGGGVFEQIMEGPLVTDGGLSFSASWVDVDSDGWVDLFVPNGGLSGAEPNFLYRNRGDGTFERITDGPVVADTVGSGGGVWGDFDNDGDPDLFVANRNADNALYRNDGDWTFTALSQDAVTSNLFPASAGAWGDVDNDDDLDLLIGGLYGGPFRLALNDGSGQFTPSPDGGDLTLDGAYAYAVNGADYDNDGDLDFAVANWGSGSVLYENDGVGRFTRKRLSPTVTYASSIAWGDYDDDGGLDLYIGNWPNTPGAGEPNHLYRNTGPVGNGVVLELEGAASNRAAIGAVVRVTAEIGGQTVTQWRDVTAHTGWRSQNALDVHVGLGDAEVAETVEVTWPSGRMQCLTNVAAGQRLTIREE